jgi:tRNA threonylcarbamoyladenosine biosynthesis protein TsaE
VAQSLALTLPDAAATERFGAALGSALRAAALPCTVFLQGTLGAGKTTLTRGLLRALGHEGRVPSPTYTLVEPYDLPGITVYHLDLYRVRSAEELLHLGLGDLAGLLLVEWPEHGAGELPAPDLRVCLTVLADGRGVVGRAATPAGAAVLGRCRP